MNKKLKVNWTDKQSVIAYAKRLGKGMIVIKRPDRDNYNITHAERADLYQKEWVIFTT